MTLPAPPRAPATHPISASAAGRAAAPAISVIINSYNYGRYLGQAIDSVLAQKTSDADSFEVIVVDDGSTDGTAAVLERYGSTILAIHQANAGQAAAINAGVRASRGAILAFLDADDRWLPGKLAAVGAAFRADPAVTLVYHRLQPVLNNGLRVMRPIPRALCSGDLGERMRRAAGWWPFPMTSSVAVRRKAWDLAGEIPTVFRISADAWLVGIYPLLGRVTALPAALGLYRIHENTWHRASDDPAMLRRRIGHWHETVAQMNGFLARQGQPPAFLLQDHLPCRIAQAQLDGASLPQRLALGWQGLRFQGEPNPLRRLRDSVRLVMQLRAAGMANASSVQA